MRISKSTLKELMALEGSLLTSRTTSETPALTRGKQYKLTQICPMYGGNIRIQPSLDSSQGPLSYIRTIIKADDNGKQKPIPIHNFIETRKIMSKRN